MQYHLTFGSIPMESWMLGKGSGLFKSGIFKNYAICSTSAEDSEYLSMCSVIWFGRWGLKFVCRNLKFESKIGWTNWWYQVPVPHNHLPGARRRTVRIAVVRTLGEHTEGCGWDVLLRVNIVTLLNFDSREGWFPMNQHWFAEPDCEPVMWLQAW